MEERILIKSEPYIIKKSIKYIAIICAILMPIILVSLSIDSNATEYALYLEHHKYYSTSWDGHWEHPDALCYYGGCEGHNMNEPRLWYSTVAYFRNVDITKGVIGLTPILAVLLLTIVNFCLRSYELVVTDKRIYGQAMFGKRVDLPIDSVSAIGSTWPKGIAVATSSGKVAFLMIRNCDEIHKCVSNLLIERQNKPVFTAVVPIKQDIPMNNADELRKYKELLDEGILTQEEFDAKKKQLLGL